MENTKKLRDLKTIITDLKNLCKQNLNEFWEETDPKKTCLLLIELAASVSSNQIQNDEIEFYRHIIQSTVLLNAALHRTNDEKVKSNITKNIQDLSRKIFIHANEQDYGQLNNNNYDIIKSTKQIKTKFLDPMRKRALDSIKEIPKILSKEPNQVEREKIRVTLVEKAMTNITKDYKTLMKNVSNEAVSMLGLPPCKFAHVAMGSLSRGLATPYSDFENAIVFEDVNDTDELRNCKRYFRCYAMLFEMIVIGFGEAPVRLAGIESLNNFYDSTNESDWFWDAVTPSGIQFDSQMPFSSKIPFGRQGTENKPWKVELIATKMQILHYLDENNVLKEGYHLGEMLSSTCLVAGCIEFFEEFHTEAQEKMILNLTSSRCINTLIDEYKKDLKAFSINKTIETFGSKLNVKRFFYRSFSVFIRYLERLTELHDSHSSSNTIGNWVKDVDGIRDDIAHNLRYALSLVNEARLNLYSKRMEQSDVVAGTQYLLDADKSTSIFNILTKHDVVCVIEIGLSWNAALIDIVEKLEENRDKSTFKTCVMQCLNKHLCQRNNYFTQGLILKHFQDYDGARELLHKSLLNTTDIKHKINICMNIGRCYIWSLEFRSAANIYKNAIDLTERLPENDEKLIILAELHDWLGQSYIEYAKEDAKHHIIESENVWKKLRNAQPDNTSYLKGLANVSDSKAWLHYKDENYEESLENYELAAELFDELQKKMKPKENLDNEIINAQNGKALCYHALKRYREAILQIKHVINLKKNLLGLEAADLNISYGTRKLASCYLELGEFENAIQFYNEAIRIRKACVGSEIGKHCSLANITADLTECYIRNNDVDKSVETAKLSFYHSEESYKTPNGPLIIRNSVNLFMKIGKQFFANQNEDKKNFETIITEVCKALDKPKYNKTFEKEREQLSSLLSL